MPKECLDAAPNILFQPASSRSTKETLEQGVKYVQS